MSWDLEPRGGAVIVHMRSNAVNRMNQSLFDDALGAFDALDRDHPGRPAILTGQGTTFSSGLDFVHVFPLFAGGAPAAIAGFFDRFREMILRVLTAPRPMVAAVNGHAFAGGFILACACDARIVARGPARFGLNEIAIGIAIPTTYLEIVRDALGARVTAEAALFARVYDVDASLAAGFAARAVDPAALLDEAVAHVAGIAGVDLSHAFAATKQALRGPLLARLEECRTLDGLAMAAIAHPSSNRAQAAAFARLKKKP
jgi:enoyl-CoA hydratase/carnithine racemase